MENPLMVCGAAFLFNTSQEETGYGFFFSITFSFESGKTKSI